MRLTVASLISLSFLAFTLVETACPPSQGQGSCNKEGGLEYGADSCYKIVENLTTWDNGYSVCAWWASKYISKFTPQYARIAVFTDQTTYENVISQLNAKLGSTIKAWIGAYSPSSAKTLDGYCWMTDQTITGSQMTTNPSIQVITSSTTNQYALYIDTADTRTYYAENRNQGAYAVICEYGCTDPRPDATCNSGVPKTNSIGCIGAYACNATGNAVSGQPTSLSTTISKATSGTSTSAPTSKTTVSASTAVLSTSTNRVLSSTSTLAVASSETTTTTKPLTAGSSTVTGTTSAPTIVPSSNSAASSPSALANPTTATTLALVSTASALPQATPVLASQSSSGSKIATTQIVSQPLSTASSASSNATVSSPSQSISSNSLPTANPVTQLTLLSSGQANSLTSQAAASSFGQSNTGASLLSSLSNSATGPTSAATAVALASQLATTAPTTQAIPSGASSTGCDPTLRPCAVSSTASTHKAASSIAWQNSSTTQQTPATQQSPFMTFTLTQPPSSATPAVSSSTSTSPMLITSMATATAGAGSSTTSNSLTSSSTLTGSTVTVSVASSKIATADVALSDVATAITAVSSLASTGQSISIISNSFSMTTTVPASSSFEQPQSSVSIISASAISLAPMTPIISSVLLDTTMPTLAMSTLYTVAASSAASDKTTTNLPSSTLLTISNLDGSSSVSFSAADTQSTSGSAQTETDASSKITTNALPSSMTTQLPTISLFATDIPTSTLILVATGATHGITNDANNPQESTQSDEPTKSSQTSQTSLPLTAITNSASDTTAPMLPSSFFPTILYSFKSVTTTPTVPVTSHPSTAAPDGGESSTTNSLSASTVLDSNASSPAMNSKSTSADNQSISTTTKYQTDLTRSSSMQKRVGISSATSKNAPTAIASTVFSTSDKESAKAITVAPSHAVTTVANPALVSLAPQPISVQTKVTITNTDASIDVTSSTLPYLPTVDSVTHAAVSISSIAEDSVTSSPLTAKPAEAALPSDLSTASLRADSATLTSTMLKAFESLSTKKTAFSQSADPLSSYAPSLKSSSFYLADKETLPAAALITDSENQPSAMLSTLDRQIVSSTVAVQGLETVARKTEPQVQDPISDFTLPVMLTSNAASSDSSTDTAFPNTNTPANEQATFAFPATKPQTNTKPIFAPTIMLTSIEPIRSTASSTQVTEALVTISKTSLKSDDAKAFLPTQAAPLLDQASPHSNILEPKPTDELTGRRELTTIIMPKLKESTLALDPLFQTTNSFHARTKAQADGTTSENAKQNAMQTLAAMTKGLTYEQVANDHTLTTVTFVTESALSQTSLDNFARTSDTSLIRTSSAIDFNSQSPQTRLDTTTVASASLTDETNAIVLANNSFGTASTNIALTTIPTDYNRSFATVSDRSLAKSITVSKYSTNTIENSIPTATDSYSDKCRVSEWGPYSSCSSTCGENIPMTRYKKYSKSESDTGNCPPEEQETSLCSLPKCVPMTQTEELISMVMMNLGCAWLLGACALAIIAAVILRSKEYLAILHLNIDISMLLCHIFVLALAQRNDKKCSRDVCKVGAIGLQYFYLVSFSLQFMEALYIHGVLTAVTIGSKALFGIKTTLAFCWGVPVIVTAATAISSFDHLISDFSCWINIGDNVFLGTLFPVMALACPTIILLEAAGTEMPGAMAENVLSCRIARAGSMMVFGTEFASWFLGATALYYQSVSLFTVVFGLNVTLGICVVVFHLSSNVEVRAMVKKAHQRLWEKMRT